MARVNQFSVTFPRSNRGSTVSFHQRARDRFSSLEGEQETQTVYKRGEKEATEAKQRCPLYASHFGVIVILRGHFCALIARDTRVPNRNTEIGVPKTSGASESARETACERAALWSSHTLALSESGRKRERQRRVTLVEQRKSLPGDAPFASDAVERAPSAPQPTGTKEERFLPSRRRRPRGKSTGQPGERGPLVKPRPTSVRRDRKQRPLLLSVLVKGRRRVEFASCQNRNRVPPSPSSPVPLSLIPAFLFFSCFLFCRILSCPILKNLARRCSRELPRA